ncbi:MAG: hypothetical protein ACO23K_01110 [Ilumatobacteraceae bacterium]
MKKLQEATKRAIINARNDADKNKAAALAMIETPMEMIKAILYKHELAVIEVLREMHESRESALRVERERCASIVERMGANGFGTLYIAAHLRTGDDYNGEKYDDQNKNSTL